MTVDQPASVLVVEDVAVVAMAAQRVLEEAGYTVVGPAANESAAEELAASRSPDLALIDIQLIHDGDGRVLARRLWERFGTPSLYVTANPADGSPGPWCCGCLAKPASGLELLVAVRAVLALLAGREPPEPPPAGLVLWGFAERLATAPAEEKSPPQPDDAKPGGTPVD